MKAPRDVVVAAVAAVLREVGSLIRSDEQIRSKAGRVIADKGGGHFAYALDEIANDIVLHELKVAGVRAKFFSEEGGWREVGDGQADYVIVCDPYCNTSLTMRGFREAAIALLMSTRDDKLAAAAIGDFQTDRIFYADSTEALILSDASTSHPVARPMQTSRVRDLDKAFVVCSAVKKDRRRSPATAALFSTVGTFHSVDGAIMIGRLAAGDIDAYLDPFKGQPLYEIPCCELILRSGGVVTDWTGAPFALGEVLRRLQHDPRNRYRLVAANTPELHQELLKLVQNSLSAGGDE